MENKENEHLIFSGFPGS